MIDINYDESKSDKIYADFSNDEFGTPLVEQAVWGEYNKKPCAQEIFEVEIERAAKAVVAAAESEGDYRPRIKDLTTNTYFLIDTGACLSVYPKKLCPSAKMDESRGLQAVNGSTIRTYGTKNVNIRLNKKNFQQEMTIADVDSAILG